MATGVENLEAYKRAFWLAMSIFETSKKFPKEEKYSLTDQIRRSSRAINANLAEAYAKRRYEAHFISKLTDADMENTETQVWLKFALECKYIDFAVYEEFVEKSKEVGRIINYLILNPKKFGITSQAKTRD
jgi:four helix bundle protein